MIFKQNLSSINKYTLICNLINDKKLEKLFCLYDEKILKKRFDDAYELSMNENILTISTISLTNKDINKIVYNFIEDFDINDFIKNRYLYELVKISNIPSLRIEKVLTEENNKKLYDKFNIFLNESKFMSADFLLLRCADNFIIKTKDSVVKNTYKNFVKKTMIKLIKNKYSPETKENTSSVLCWFDRILCAAVNLDISVGEFISINRNILNTSFSHIDILWKCLNIVNYLSFHKGFYDIAPLRKFKREILKKIKNYYSLENINKEETLKTCIKVLSKNTANKEDFYHFFNMVKILAEKDDCSKEFAINLCEFTVYMDAKQNIFCYRFIRESFINLLNQLIKKEDCTPIKEKELHLLINIFYNSPFFYIYKKDIFEKILNILISFPSKKNKGLQRKYYKYCDILDYIVANDKDLHTDNIIDKLASDKKNKDILKQRFDLSFKNSV